MSESLSQKAKPLVTAEVVRLGEAIAIPVAMSIGQAITQLQEVAKYEESETSLQRTFNVMPMDGAYGLMKVIEQKYGWVSSIPTPGFFGSKPPQMLSTASGVGETVSVLWGRIRLPDVDGFMQTDASFEDGRWVFKLHANILRKHQATVDDIFNRLENYLKTNSLYAGKAIKIRFRNSQGNPIEDLKPEFMDLSKVSRDMLIYSEEVQNSINVELFTPIERLADCKANGIEAKRGVLLGGPYGTGKTLAATVAAKLAQDNGITYLYVPHCSELADAIQFAKQYSRTACVIFCEDIDRAVTGERSVQMDDILNILDGIDTKGTNIITVLTTNHLEDINPAMLRPGRIDSVINVTAPDAVAVQKLVRFYGKDTIDPNADLSKVGEALAGVTPAIVAETVKRAKLAQLSLQPKGTMVTMITAEALLASVHSMAYQIEVLKKLSEKEKPEKVSLEDMLSTALVTALEKYYE